MGNAMSDGEVQRRSIGARLPTANNLHVTPWVVCIPFPIFLSKCFFPRPFQGIMSPMADDLKTITAALGLEKN